ncbi:glycosyltransferase family 4 protein [Dyadobacter crusticola]|uniref:glycosyltransferase family 4 protein n=1 Tax=Dyadobacter crusticola TaxID=292407 RepID=UPI0004E2298E|nr:glycosyltransferase family 4 protein [Dyadobacter crusticola]
MNKEKILFVHHSGNLGGAPRSLSFLLDKINYVRYDVNLLCIKKGPGLNLFKERPLRLFITENIFPFHGSTVSGMHFKLFVKNFLFLPQSFLNARKFIQDNRPKLIHLNSSCLFAVAIAAKSVNKEIKVVCHVREPLLKNSLCGKVIKHFAFKYVDEFIAIDKFSAASMKTRGNVRIIYNAVNFEDYNSKIASNILREELNLPINSIIFLYLARFSESNGTLALVEAARTLTAKHSNFHFVVAGLKPELTDTYTNKVVQSANGDPQIHFIPFREDVPSIIASSDILVVPFTKPHFARSIVEASAMGKPSIGANLGGVNELIVDKVTGFLYETPEQFCKYCEILGNDQPARRKMGGQAELFARKNFDNQINSQRVFQVYEELLTKSF